MARVAEVPAPRGGTAITHRFVMAIAWHPGALEGVSSFHAVSRLLLVDFIHYLTLFASSGCCARMVLLMMLAVALNATIMVEQPGSSMLEFYPRWRIFAQALERCGGRGTVASLHEAYSFERMYIGKPESVPPGSAVKSACHVGLAS